MPISIGYAIDVVRDKCVIDCNGVKHYGELRADRVRTVVYSITRLQCRLIISLIRKPMFPIFIVSAPCYLR
jgi:hypothetical protein